MENKLKPETTPVIDQLNLANIRTIMVTGMYLSLLIIEITPELSILSAQGKKKFAVTTLETFLY
jgi:hypothetical protein